LATLSPAFCRDLGVLCGSEPTKDLTAEQDRAIAEGRRELPNKGAGIANTR